ncbi:MAG: hypothetical protein HPY53_07055 [Brevinematales bacterium]|nr:hypothetical protein [Brevinematales bacterium]
MLSFISTWYSRTPIIITIHDDPSFISIIINVFIAVGTVGAVIVAIFLEPIKRLIERPKLEIEYTEKAPDKQKIPLIKEYINGDKDVFTVYYFRLRIWNQGKASALHPEVYIASIENQKLHMKVKTFIPINLAWTHYNSVSIDSIPSNSFRLLNLGYIPLMISEFKNNRIDDSQYKHSKNEFVFATIIEAISEKNLFNHIPFGNYRIELHLSGSNFKTVKKYLTISLFIENDIRSMSLKIL